MTNGFQYNTSVIWSWTALIGIAAIVCAVTRGTSFQQLGIGLLTAAIALLVAVAVFEAIWRSAAKLLDRPASREAPKSAPKHRQRGQ
jgi:divalent metal cation (Fe/Co/Zn/Cd) transporter